MPSPAPLDIRRVQLARILGLPPAALTGRRAGAELAAHPAELAQAFFHEAANNDDVISPETALEYLEGRLAFFAGLIPDATLPTIRALFDEHLTAWEDNY
jgi:hypothetical protein